jgi:RNA polymerase sigma-70 factor (ECF subfamily)
MITRSTNYATLPALLGNLAKRKLTRENFENASDTELVNLTMRGTSRAYETLVRRYQKLVYNVLFQMLQNHESAADVTQDTFVRAFNGLHTFRKDAPFKPWLLRIASNSGLNKIRESKLRDHDSLDSMLEENAHSEPASGQNVEAEVEWRLSQVMLTKALETLPVRQKHIFLLRYQHDLSYADIAQITDESESSVKSILFRTREKLRKMLQEDMRLDATERTGQ